MYKWCTALDWQCRVPKIGFGSTATLARITRLLNMNTLTHFNLISTFVVYVRIPHTRILTCLTVLPKLNLYLFQSDYMAQIKLYGTNEIHLKIKRILEKVLTELFSCSFNIGPVQ